MKAKKYWILTISLLGLLGIISVTSSCSEPNVKIPNEKIEDILNYGYGSSGGHIPKLSADRYVALSGLKTIQLLVTSLYEEGKEVGLSREEVTNEVRLELEKTKLTIVGDCTTVQNEDIPILMLKLFGFTHPKSSSYTFSCELMLIEKASTKRNPNITHFAKIWWLPAIIGRTSKDQLTEQIKVIVKSQMNKFVNDYLAANPKEQSKDRQKQ